MSFIRCRRLSSRRVHGRRRETHRQPALRPGPVHDEFVAAGGYASASEVIRALRERDAAVEPWLRDEAASDPVCEGVTRLI
jgi:hypothetical protein